MTFSIRDLLEFVSRSDLLPRGEAESLLDSVPSHQQPSDVYDMARLLVDSDKLTEYQAERLLEGRWQNLVLGEYAVLERLGGGGMGEVYRALHRRMDRVVALKVLNNRTIGSPEGRARFEREVKALGRLRHPNIVTAFDAGEHNGMPYLVMEFVEGQNLAELVREHGPLSVATSVDYIRQTARGLEYAHSLGVVHRDVKPGNLLLDAGDTIRILDLGLARLQWFGSEGAQADGLTEAGIAIGTLDFMAPEQADDARSVDGRADIYSLGCTLYYLLTGEAPYGVGSMLDRLLAHRQQPVPSLRAMREDVGAELEVVHASMMAKNPEDRPETMTALVAMLEGLLPTLPTSAPRLRGLSEAAKSSARRPGRGWSAVSGVAPTKTLAAASAVTQVEPTAEGSVTKRAPRWRRGVVWGAAALACAIVGAGIWLGTRTAGAPNPEETEPETPLAYVEAPRDPVVQRMTRALNSPVSAECSECPLEEFVQMLGKQQQIAIVLDTKALEDAGVAPDTLVTQRARKLSLRSALGLALRQFGLDWRIANESLLVTTEDNARLQETRTYPVGDLVERGDYDSLVDTITTVIEPQQWEEVGGPGSLQVLPPQLVILQSERLHYQVECLLAELRRKLGLHNAPRTPADVRESENRGQLATTVSCDFVEVPLVDALDQLTARGKVPVELDLKTLEDKGMGADTPVTFNATTISVLNGLLSQLEIAWVVRDEVVLVTSNESALLLTTRVYPVRDLVQTSAAPKKGGGMGGMGGGMQSQDKKGGGMFSVPEQAIRPPGSANGRLDSPRLAQRAQPKRSLQKPDLAQLIETITSTIAPVTWDEVDGPGVISSFRGLLVVSQNETVHAEIAARGPARRAASRQGRAAGAQALNLLLRRKRFRDWRPREVQLFSASGQGGNESNLSSGSAAILRA
jgi:serine/threonine protein kinase